MYPPILQLPKPDASWLNPYFCFILMVPFDSDDLKGIVYVWVGKRADHKEARIAEEIAYVMYKVGCFLAGSGGFRAVRESLL